MQKALRDAQQQHAPLPPQDTSNDTDVAGVEESATSGPTTVVGEALSRPTVGLGQSAVVKRTYFNSASTTTR